MLPSCNVSASMFAWRRRQSVSLNRRMEGLLSTRNGSRTTRPSFRVARDPDALTLKFLYDAMVQTSLEALVIVIPSHQDRRGCRCCRYSSEPYADRLQLRRRQAGSRQMDLAPPKAVVRNIQVRVTNPRKTDAAISSRGDLVLWLPDALYDGAPRVGGRYEIVAPKAGLVPPGLLRRGSNG